MLPSQHLPTSIGALMDPAFLRRAAIEAGPQTWMDAREQRSQAAAAMDAIRRLASLIRKAIGSHRLA
jgi:hypothetical protein